MSDTSAFLIEHLAAGRWSQASLPPWFSGDLPNPLLLTLAKTQDVPGAMDWLARNFPQYQAPTTPEAHHDAYLFWLRVLKPAAEEGNVDWLVALHKKIPAVMEKELTVLRLACTQPDLAAWDFALGCYTRRPWPTTFLVDMATTQKISQPHLESLVRHLDPRSIRKWCTAMQLKARSSAVHVPSFDQVLSLCWPHETVHVEKIARATAEPLPLLTALRLQKSLSEVVPIAHLPTPSRARL